MYLVMMKKHLYGSLDMQILMQKMKMEQGHASYLSENENAAKINDMQALLSELKEAMIAELLVC